MEHSLRKRLREAGLLIFIVSFFAILGSDYSDQIRLRIVYGSIFLFVFILTFNWKQNLDSFKNVAVCLFFAVILYELVRALWAFLMISKGVTVLSLQRFLSAPLEWILYFGFFLVSYLTFRTKPSVIRLLWLLGGCGFLIAINTIPPLLLNGQVGYQDADGQWGVFYPLLYFHPLIKRYLLGSFAYVNITGDVIALGFFPALSLLFYGLRKWEHGFSLVAVTFSALIAGVCAVATVLFLSRGTIISFAAAFLLYIGVTLIKFPSRKNLFLTGLGFAMVLGFIFWAGDVQKALKEMQTIQKEFHPGEVVDTSFSNNKEGARRAIAIYKANPVWGVGTDGYSKVSLQFATPGTEGSLANVMALCHYLQLLVEEGIGAFFYLLFLIAYFLAILKGLWVTKSRFQFYSSLALASAVLMVLIHASINQLMQRFSISMLIYILMGASLAVLSKDFGHNQI